MFEKLKDYFIQLEKKKAMTLFKRYPDLYMEHVKQLSTEISLRLSMKYLDQERVLHCAVCPSRQQLRRIGKLIYCPKCAPAAAKTQEHLNQKVGGVL